MRRRWRWPILDSLRNTEVAEWVVAWGVWLIVTGLVIVLPAMIVDSDASGAIYLGTYLRDALIVWGVPVAAGVLVAVVLLVRVMLAEYGSKLIPRRVTEPVREDLRTVERR